jgi:hypothetical protein
MSVYTTAGYGAPPTAIAGPNGAAAGYSGGFGTGMAQQGPNATALAQPVKPFVPHPEGYVPFIDEIQLDHVYWSDPVFPKKKDPVKQKKKASGPDADELAAAAEMEDGSNSRTKGRRKRKTAASDKAAKTSKTDDGSKVDEEKKKDSVPFGPTIYCRYGHPKNGKPLRFRFRGTYKVPFDPVDYVTKVCDPTKKGKICISLNPVDNPVECRILSVIVNKYIDVVVRNFEALYHKKVPDLNMRRQLALFGFYSLLHSKTSEPPFAFGMTYHPFSTDPTKIQTKMANITHVTRDPATKKITKINHQDGSIATCPRGSRLTPDVCIEKNWMKGTEHGFTTHLLNTPIFPSVKMNLADSLGLHKQHQSSAMDVLQLGDGIVVEGNATPLAVQETGGDPVDHAEEEGKAYSLTGAQLDQLKPPVMSRVATVVH